MEARTFRQRKQAKRSRPPPDAERTARKAKPRRAERVDRGRSARRKPNPLFSDRPAGRAFGPELRRAPAELASQGPGSGRSARQRWQEGHPVKGTEEIARSAKDPRDRPGPKGLGRNPLPGRPKPSPARDLDPGEVGAGGNAGPHCFVPVRRSLAKAKVRRPRRLCRRPSSRAAAATAESRPGPPAPPSARPGSGPPPPRRRARR